ncbi:MAG: transcription antitermination factor NusB [Proteobacteria bacterium]|nr:transcription antitermination factor NusB [Pseudomonadota bacterium]
MKNNPTTTVRSGKASFKGRMAARLAAVQALFQIEQTGATASTVVLEFLEHRLKQMKPKVDSTFFSKLVEGAWREHERSDEIITGALRSGWTLDRLESVTRAILRAALYEITETQTPVPVIIDEYLNLTHAFFDDAEVAFVNGVLNTVSQKIRPFESLKTNT